MWSRLAALLLTLAVAGCGNEHDLVSMFGNAGDESDPLDPPDGFVAGDDDDDGSGDDDDGDDGGIPGDGCTFTQGYWKNHESAWPVQSLSIGGVTYSKTELLALFGTAPSGDASLILAHQLTAALLNIANGAGAPESVAQAIDSSDQWMSANADGDGRLSFGVHGGDAHEGATALADVLAGYNEGAIGPGHCE